MLEWGPASPYAASFDIDWEQLPYRAEAASCCRSSARPTDRRWSRAKSNFAMIRGGSFSAWYFEHRLPISPERYSEILRALVKEARAGSRPPATRILDLASRQPGFIIPTARKLLPSRRSCNRSKGAARSSNAGLKPTAPAPGAPDKTSALHHLLERQHYRVAHWRLASSDINYRRFFDVNRWRACGSRTPGLLRRRTGWSPG